MSDEIKEILDILKKCKDYDDEVYLIKQHGATLLLDYITNLQEENVRFREIICFNEYYKSRIDKAIDYIKKNKKEITKERADFYNEDRQNKLKIGTFMWGVDELLNILNGGDKE